MVPIGTFYYALTLFDQKYKKIPRPMEEVKAMMENHCDGDKDKKNAPRSSPRKNSKQKRQTPYAAK